MKIKRLRVNYCVLALTMLMGMGCSPQYTPYYFSNANTIKPIDSAMYNYRLRVDVFNDKRGIEHNKLLNTNQKNIMLKGVRTCLNAEGKYRSDVMKLLSMTAAKYIFESTPLRKASVSIQDYDYRLSWDLVKYQAVQEFSKEARGSKRFKGSMIVAFGLIGGLAAEATTKDYFTSPGEVEIVIDNIKLVDTTGKLVKNFDRLQVHVLEDLPADANCECAYYNVDFQFKKLVKGLAEEIEIAIKNDLSSK